jgi:hypothetical protein
MARLAEWNRQEVACTLRHALPFSNVVNLHPLDATARAWQFSYAAHMPLVSVSHAYSM